MIHTLIVNNIKCHGCGASIISRLSKIDDVSDVQVDPSKGEVKFESATENVINDVKNTLANMGYTEEDPNALQTAKSYVSCMIGKMKQN